MVRRWTMDFVHESTDLFVFIEDQPKTISEGPELETDWKYTKNVEWLHRSCFHADTQAFKLPLSEDYNPRPSGLEATVQ